MLGPIGGILIADYFVYRRRELNLAALYQRDGEYSYAKGWSMVAIFSLVIAVLPSVPGFLIHVKLRRADAVPGFFAMLYDYAWFVGFGIAFVVYLTLRRMLPRR